MAAAREAIIATTTSQPGGAGTAPTAGSDFSAGEAKSDPVQGQEEAMLTDAPTVPPPITRTHATKVIVKLEVQELVKRMADGVDYMFWTFGGKVPGKFIRIRHGDEVEFHLMNRPDSKMPHNIDLHAVTGPGGGAAASFTAPGHESVFSFKAHQSRALCLSLRHRAGRNARRQRHVWADPRRAEGRPAQSGQGVLCDAVGVLHQGPLRRSRRAAIQHGESARRESPIMSSSTASVGAIAGDNAMPAKVGDKIRLFVGNGGPNLVSSFHVIGEIFDNVYQEGGIVPTQHQVQTTLIPAGGSAIVDFATEVPGTYILVDHSIFRAFNKGAARHDQSQRRRE